MVHTFRSCANRRRGASVCPHNREYAKDVHNSGSVDIAAASNAQRTPGAIRRCWPGFLRSEEVATEKNNVYGGTLWQFSFWREHGKPHIDNNGAFPSGGKTFPGRYVSW